MLRAISLLRSPSTTCVSSITTLIFFTSSSVRSLTRVSGFTPASFRMRFALSFRSDETRQLLHGRPEMCAGPRQTSVNIFLIGMQVCVHPAMPLKTWPFRFLPGNGIKQYYTWYSHNNIKSVRTTHPGVPTAAALKMSHKQQDGNQPCLCLCFGFSQITLMLPFLLIILHLSQIGFTDDLTFIGILLSFLYFYNAQRFAHKSSLYSIALQILECKGFFYFFVKCGTVGKRRERAAGAGFADSLLTPAFGQTEHCVRPVLGGFFLWFVLSGRTSPFSEAWRPPPDKWHSCIFPICHRQIRHGQTSFLSARRYS